MKQILQLTSIAILILFAAISEAGILDKTTLMPLPQLAVGSFDLWLLPTHQK